MTCIFPWPKTCYHAYNNWFNNFVVALTLSSLHWDPQPEQTGAPGTPQTSPTAPEHETGATVPENSPSIARKSDSSMASYTLVRLSLKSAGKGVKHTWGCWGLRPTAPPAGTGGPGSRERGALEGPVSRARRAAAPGRAAACPAASPPAPPLRGPLGAWQSGRGRSAQPA